jgi:hypothetical protein
MTRRFLVLFSAPAEPPPPGAILIPRGASFERGPIDA